MIKRKMNIYILLGLFILTGCSKNLSEVEFLLTTHENGKEKSKTILNIYEESAVADIHESLKKLNVQKAPYFKLSSTRTVYLEEGSVLSTVSLGNIYIIKDLYKNNFYYFGKNINDLTGSNGSLKELIKNTVTSLKEIIKSQNHNQEVH